VSLSPSPRACKYIKEKLSVASLCKKKGELQRRRGGGVP
jgi:hypothetical protein